MTKRLLRQMSLTAPITALLLWLAAGRYADTQRQEHQETAREVSQALTLGAMLYAQDHGDRLPPAQNWEEVVRPYLGAVPITLPPAPGTAGRRFALNRAVAGRKLTGIPNPAAVILFFTSTSDAPSPCDDFETMLPADTAEPLMIGYVGGQSDVYPAGKRNDLIALSRRALQTSEQDHTSLNSVSRSATLKVTP